MRKALILAAGILAASALPAFADGYRNTPFKLIEGVAAVDPRLGPWIRAAWIDAWREKPSSVRAWRNRSR